MNGEANSGKQYVQAFQFGEEKAFDFFFREHYAPLCYFAKKFVPSDQAAEDLVQDCFVKLWSRHTILNKPEAIKSFLYTTVRNACLNYKEHFSYVNTQHSQIEYLDQKTDTDVLQQITRAETIREIHLVLQALPPKMQRVFRMFFIQGKTYNEIATELNLSVQTIRNQKSQALSLIRKKISLLMAILIFLFH